MPTCQNPTGEWRLHCKSQLGFCVFDYGVTVHVVELSIRRELDYLDLSKNKLASVEGLDSLENLAFVNLGE
jgi:Leucine-rich repeat (LRR) protein